MQPTGRRGAKLHSGGTLSSALLNVGLCGREHDRPQLMRKSLDSDTEVRSMAEYYGSRRHVLDWVEQPTFLQDLTELLRPLPVHIRSGDALMPRGRAQPREARLESFGPKVLNDQRIWDELKGWWLAHGGNTPNWDIAAACTIEDRRGLVLVEAKANIPELSEAGKRLVGPRGKKGEKPKAPSERAKCNDARIRAAIAQAGEALAADNTCKPFTAASHYQLTNRLAFSWKLASLGVPVALVYLGFCGDHGIVRVGEPFATDEHWATVCRSYMSPCFPMTGAERRIEVSNTPVWVAIRSRYVLSQSPPVAV